MLKEKLNSFSFTQLKQKNPPQNEEFLIRTIGGLLP
jgi:hypothetical protein